MLRRELFRSLNPSVDTFTHVGENACKEDLGLSDDDLAVLAKRGDLHARNRLWESSLELTHVYLCRLRAVRKFDLLEIKAEVSAAFPTILERYNPRFAKRGWGKYLKQALYHACLEALRTQDPLGLRPRAKRPYPKFQHLGDAPHHVIQEGICAIDRGYLQQASS